MYKKTRWTEYSTTVGRHHDSDVPVLIYKKTLRSHDRHFFFLRNDDGARQQTEQDVTSEEIGTTAHSCGFGASIQYDGCTSATNIVARLASGGGIAKRCLLVGSVRHIAMQ